MSTKGLIIGGSVLGVIIVLLVVALCIGGWIMGIYNTEVKLRNVYEAKHKTIETAHDTMWKSVSQKYKISKDYENTFLNGLRAVATGREGGSVFKSNNESSSQLGLSTDVFNQMMATIEGQRAMLKREQDTMVDMYRQHKNHCEVFPNSLLIGNRVLPEPQIISSTRTKDAFETGVDNDISM